jgi:hypothetical protein
MSPDTSAAVTSRETNREGALVGKPSVMVAVGNRFARRSLLDGDRMAPPDAMANRDETS